MDGQLTWLNGRTDGEMTNFVGVHCDDEAPMLTADTWEDVAPARGGVPLSFCMKHCKTKEQATVNDSTYGMFAQQVKLVSRVV